MERFHIVLVIHTSACNPCQFVRTLLDWKPFHSCSFLWESKIWQRNGVKSFISVFAILHRFANFLEIDTAQKHFYIQQRHKEVHFKRFCMILWNKSDLRLTIEIYVYYSKEHICTLYIIRLDDRHLIGTFLLICIW